MKKIEQLQSRENNLRLFKMTRKKISRHLSFLPKINQSLFGHPIINVPVKFDLIDGDNQTLCYDFFKEIEDICKKKPGCIYLSFKETEILKAMPMLILYSIIDHARETTKSKIKINIIWSKKSTLINKFINNSGSFLPSIKRENSLGSVKALPVIMGDNSKANELSNLIIDYILDNYFHDATPEKEQQISSAIQETVDNVGRHAYPDIHQHSQKKWWLCCNRVGNNLFLAIYDKGIGIPSSLSEHNAVMLSRINSLYPNEYTVTLDDPESENVTKDNISAFIRVQFLKERLTDGQLIRAAMHTSISATKLHKHGQGSKSIKGLISDHDDNSFLLMLSNKGYYSYNKIENDNDNSVKNREYIIPGTLIQWSI